MPNGDKQKVVILGGGCGGVTAAFELTATQELQDRFEVELYTLGWRLGGKGASGRNRDHWFRIEEHGLHVWFGFYDNSFDVLRQAYQQMDKPANPLFNDRGRRVPRVRQHPAAGTSAQRANGSRCGRSCRPFRASRAASRGRCCWSRSA